MNIPASLHNHSDYSFLDGIASVEELIDAAVNAGHKAVALTDHGNMCGAIRFYRYALEKSIKPIIGQEFYFVDENNFRVPQNKTRHIILLAKNAIGYGNLVKLSTFAHIKGFYYNPRINFEILREHSEGLICLTACLSGIISKEIMLENYNEAKRKLNTLKDIFKDDLYIELQSNSQEEQIFVNRLLIDYAEEFDIKCVVTNDVHYIKQDDFYAHDAWTCIKFGNKVSDLNRMKHEVNDYYFNAEIPEYLKQYVSNINEVVDKCNVKIELGVRRFPSSDVKDPIGHIRIKCIEVLDGLSVFIGNVSEYSERMKREIDVIDKLGFGHYFVIIQEIVQWARDRGIRVSPARGSAAGSLVCYLLGITQDINPIKFGLIFERFLHEERISPPDIDLDFQQDRRNEVIEHIIEKYGAKYVSSIGTFSMMKSKNAIKDAMRVLGVDFAIANEISKMVSIHAETIEQAIEMNPELAARISQNKLVHEAIELAKKFEGHIRQPGTHAAGMVISPVPLDEIIPLQRVKGEIATQFDMRDIEKLGLLKVDILGLRTLTVIEDTIKMAQKDGHLSGEPDWSLDDPAVFRMIARGETKGCFMIETALLTQAAIDFKIANFDDLTLLGAICRPVAMATGQKDECLHNRKNQDGIKYYHPALEKILKDTYGVVVYQEQIMEIFRELALFTWAESDNVRSLISKGAQLSERDKKKKLSSAKHRFDVGTQKTRVKPKIASRVWDLVKNATYGFNKSHATSYAFISYQTAWLKHYFPEYFMAAVLSSVASDTDRVAEYVRECRRMDVEILRPHVVKSKIKFAVEQGRIRYGFNAIKAIGIKSALKIVDAIDSCSCSSLIDIVEADKIFGRKKILESLVCTGAMDDYIKTRRSVMEQLTHICKEVRDYHKRLKDNKAEKAMDSLFSDEVIESITEVIHPKLELDTSLQEFDDSEIAMMEKEFLGIFLTDNPLDKYRNIFLKYCAVTKGDVEAIREKCLRDKRESGFFGGVVIAIKVFTTRNGDEMAHIQIETIPGVYQTVCFNKEWYKLKKLLQVGNSIILKVSTTKTGDFVCRDARHVEQIKKR